MKFSAGEVCAITGGVIASGDSAAVADGITNDTRTARSGMGFVAVEAERDGHDFLADAARAGCTLAIVRKSPDELAAAVSLRDMTVIKVDDQLNALAQLAAAMRRDRLADATVVGVTGSVGKTSTKDLIVAAAGSQRVTANAASYNNELGLPMTVLGASEATELLVLEMGARFAGNIAELCTIAAPKIGVITNIGLAHAEHLGGRDGVLNVKAELLDALPTHGTAILPFDDTTERLRARGAAAVITVGAVAGADIIATVVGLSDDLRATVEFATPWGNGSAVLGLRGEHQAVNAAMALAVALTSGCALHRALAGLETARGSDWRMDLQTSSAGIAVLNDAYNANPASMSAALAALAELPVRGRRVAVLGAMRELGTIAEAEHRSIGSIVSRLGIDVLFAVGDEGAWIATGADGLTTVEHVTDVNRAIERLLEYCQAGDAVLLKASRAVGLERAAAALLSGEIQ